MATTTNYSWTTPDDTDLVKDGAAAIRTLGSAIDTSFAADQGDLLIGGTSDIFEPLTIGAASTVLTSNGTTASWVAPAAPGGMTLLDTMTLSGASTTSATFSSAYTALKIYIKAAVNSTPAELRMRFNADTASNYSFMFILDAAVAASSDGTTSVRVGNIGSDSGIKRNTNQIIDLLRPSDTDQVFLTTTAQSYDAGIKASHCTGIYDNSAGITSITIFPSTGTMSAGTVLIYGAN